MEHCRLPYRFKLPDNSCVIKINNYEITTNTLILNSGQIITRHALSDINCNTPIAILNYLNAVCADDNKNMVVNWSATDVFDR